MEKVREDVEQRTKMEDIRNIMEYLKCTAGKAMEILRVPEIDQQKYLAKL